MQVIAPVAIPYVQPNPLPTMKPLPKDVATQSEKEMGKIPTKQMPTAPTGTSMQMTTGNGTATTMPGYDPRTGMMNMAPMIMDTSKYSIFYSIKPNEPPQMGMFLDLNKDQEVQMKMVEYFYRKTLEKWILKTSMFDALNYLVVNKDGVVEPIKDMSQYDKERAKKDSDEVIVKKIKYIKHDVLDRKDVWKALSYYVRPGIINWFDLKAYSKEVRSIIGEVLMHNIEKLVKHGKKSKKEIE